MKTANRFTLVRMTTLAPFAVAAIAVGCSSASDEAIGDDSTRATTGASGEAVSSVQSSATTLTTCTFHADTNLYASEPGGELEITWELNAPNEIQSIVWAPAYAPWFAYGATPADHGHVTGAGYYFDVEGWVTTRGYEPFAYRLAGKIIKNVHGGPSGAVFAGVYEGTGSAWIVADGKVACSSPQFYWPR